MYKKKTDQKHRISSYKAKDKKKQPAILRITDYIIKITYKEKAEGKEHRIFSSTKLTHKKFCNFSEESIIRKR